jgi:predicted HAD superfamily Cof-like phosphohydrolase
MSKNWVKDINDFEKEVCGVVHPSIPTIVSEEKKKLRIDLIKEEINETLNAIEENNMIEIMDGITDSIVVLIGTAITYGVDLRPIWDEVHKTNMAKKDGKIREDGKKMKPEGWKPPDVRNELVKQGWHE